MSGRHLSALCAVVIGLCFAGSSFAQGAPSQMAFQGRLVRSDGTPESGTHTLVFSLYSVATGGAAVWTETIPNVAVTNGYYGLILGRDVTLDPAFFSGGPMYLGIAISGQSEFTPRVNLVSVPYAMKSAEADRATNANFAASAQDASSLGGRPAADYADASHTHSEYANVNHTHSGYAADNHTHAVATSSAAGFMSASDKATLDNAVTTAGAGLTKSGSTISANFGGNGSASTVARSDHTHAAPTLSCTYRTASGTSFVTAYCATTEALTGGACPTLNTGSGYVHSNVNGVSTVSGANNTGGPGYRCASSTSDTVEALAICCRVVP